MENLVIEGKTDTYFTPSVSFDAGTGILEISGESYLEDTRSFYIKLVSWIEQYITEIKGPIILNIRLTYYNTSSSKSLLEIFYTLKEYEDKGGQVKVNWYLDEDDIEIEEEIEDFQIDSDLQINRIQINE